jgi:hypothetical protein
VRPFSIRVFEDFRCLRTGKMPVPLLRVETQTAFLYG